MLLGITVFSKGRILLSSQLLPSKHCIFGQSQHFSFSPTLREFNSSKTSLQEGWSLPSPSKKNVLCPLGDLDGRPVSSSELISFSPEAQLHPSADILRLCHLFNPCKWLTVKCTESGFKYISLGWRHGPETKDTISDRRQVLCLGSKKLCMISVGKNWLLNVLVNDTHVLVMHKIYGCQHILSLLRSKKYTMRSKSEIISLCYLEHIH